MVVEFRLLGPIEVHHDGRQLDVGHLRQRCVLAALLVDANQAVQVETLVDRIWGRHRLPIRPTAAVQTYVSLLRRALAAVDGVRIVRRAAGYAITVAEEAVDLHRFRALVGRAGGADDAGAATLYEQALGLWRGEPFATLDTPWLNGVRTALDRQRRAARLDLCDIRLRDGQHAALLTELSDLAREQPLDERVAGQLMLALYRSGRQAEALEHYQAVRRRLADDLGADPSPPLQHRHRQILTADPVLAPAVARPAAAPVPRQLPAAPRLFTGRDRELAALTSALDAQAGTALAVLAIAGPGGIGKTWLALHWAHRHLDRFPDGQLYLNLRGYDPSGDPVPAGTALRGLLDAFGVDPAAIPRNPDARAGLYRSLLAERRMLILLDNAADAGQVAPLLPGSPTCTVLVTSRRHLTGLVAAHGAHSQRLDLLTEPEAERLLDRHLGPDRPAAEPRATAELLRACAGLPLAIGIVAARASGHPDLPLAVLAEELRDHTGRLNALDGGDPHANLRAVFSWSRDALSREAATVFGLLALAPGPDIGTAAATVLTGLPPQAARQVLRDLEDAHLLHRGRPDRYRMHDLLRLYAVEQAPRDRAADACLRRLVDHYLATAVAAERLLNPHRAPVDAGPPAPAGNPEPLPDQAAAIGWLDTEHPCLLAAQELALTRGWYAAVWQLAWALSTFHRRQGRFHDQLAAWQNGLAAARQSGDRGAQTLAHRRLGLACARTGRHTEAIDHLATAVRVADDLLSQAHGHQALGSVHERLGNGQAALEHTARAVELFRRAGAPVWEAEALNGLGWCLAKLGRYPEAREHCEAALAALRRLRYRDGEANTLDSLRYIADRTGQHAQALDYAYQELALYRELGHTYEEANTLDRIAHVHTTLGHPALARAAWQQALDQYRAQRRTAEAERTRECLRLLDNPQG
jgi:DNA-binding SARP family transcriptional activator/tetratricopeptide (TPR) repeat protein